MSRRVDVAVLIETHLIEEVDLDGIKSTLKAKIEDAVRTTRGVLKQGVAQVTLEGQEKDAAIAFPERGQGEPVKESPTLGEVFSGPRKK